MSDQAKQMTDDEAAEFAEQVFDVARKGDAAMLAALLAKGLPANFRNHNGDTLLMLAAYHGHADAVKVLLEFKADWHRPGFGSVWLRVVVDRLAT
jgi:ankyrin repeat protein